MPRFEISDGGPLVFGFYGLWTHQGLWGDNMLSHQDTARASKKHSLHLPAAALLASHVGTCCQEGQEATATAQEASDVLLDFGVDTMPAGSQLLRLASPVFNRMLESGMKKAQQSIIKVDVASKQEFKIFYDLLTPFSWSKDKITEANVDALLTISDYYQVEIVKDGCEQLLLSLPPTCNRLFQAQKHGLKTQYERCIASMAKKDELQILRCHPDTLMDVALKQQAHWRELAGHET